MYIPAIPSPGSNRGPVLTPIYLLLSVQNSLQIPFSVPWDPLYLVNISPAMPAFSSGLYLRKFIFCLGVFVPPLSCQLAKASNCLTSHDIPFHRSGKFFWLLKVLFIFPRFLFFVLFQSYLIAFHYLCCDFVFIYSFHFLLRLVSLFYHHGIAYSYRAFLNFRHFSSILSSSDENYVLFLLLLHYCSFFFSTYILRLTSSYFPTVL